MQSAFQSRGFPGVKPHRRAPYWAKPKGAACCHGGQPPVESFATTQILALAHGDKKSDDSSRDGFWFFAQWPLENRDCDGTRLGLDLNVLAAWPYGQGKGVLVAVADGGLEMNHPELTNRLAGSPHFNFDTQTTNAGPFGGTSPDLLMAVWTHGTSVAGLIAAEVNNDRGMAGVAPLARLASWVVFDTNGVLVSDEQLMDMYQFASDTVGIQNHSWGGVNGSKAQTGPTLLEQIGIANAVTLGRNGLGTVMVRSAGNDRSLLARADDDG